MTRLARRPHRYAARVRGFDVRRWMGVALLVVGVVAAALTIGLRALPAFEWLEYRTLQARFSIRGQQPPSPEVVVVALDLESTRHVDRPPIARSIDAELVDDLRRAGASVVAFDFTLEQRSDSRTGDLALARALQRTGAAVVSVNAVRTDGGTEDLVGRVPYDPPRVRPGNTFLPTDGDRAVRRFPTALHGVPSFAVLAAALHSPRARIAPAPRGALIDFAGPAGTVPTLSLADVLAGRVDLRALRRKIVVFGPTAPVLQDLHATAVAGSPMSGPEIQANAIATALAGYPLRTMSSAAVALLLFVLTGAVALLQGLRATRASITAGNVVLGGAAVLALWTVAAQVAFDAGAVVDYSTGVFAVLTTSAGAGGLASIAGRRERREQRELFAAYSPNAVRRVLAQGSASPPVVTRSEIITGYRIEEVIGEGGMGVVYRATELRLEREVALKLIRPQFALQDVFRARFERETRAAARVSHPSIVSVYDAGEDDGLLYIAMMLVDGVDLSHTIAVFGPLETATLVTILRQIASALDAAHAKGLVHRDVKPANILVTADAHHAYLTDFGIAKQVGADDGLTNPGGWVGTVDYLAPEIAGGAQAGPPSDIYALTAVLYFCVAGSVPFDLPNEAAKLRAHADAPPPSLVAAPPGRSRELDAVIARGMAKRPTDRYPTASEMAEAAAHALGFAAAGGQPPDGRLPPGQSGAATEPTE